MASDRKLMTLPFPAYEFQHLFHTRRTILQRYLLLPDEGARNLYRYTLGLAASEPTRPMKVHAAVQMSNHIHEVIFDRRGRDSDYRAHKNSVLARALNALRKIKGRVFDTPTRRNREVLLDQAAVLAAIVYTFCNPVQAGICDWPDEWPGTLGDWRRVLSTPIVAVRPTFFFDQRDPDRGGAPLRVRFYLTKPPAFDHLTRSQYERLIRESVKDECMRIHAERSQPVFGVRRALELSWEHVPVVQDREIERGAYSFVGDPELVKRLLLEWMIFVAHYMEVRSRWLRGEREGVEFPPGTDKIRHRERAPTARLDADSPYASFHS